MGCSPWSYKESQFEIVLVGGGGTLLRGLVGCPVVPFERLLGH